MANLETTTLQDELPALAKQATEIEYKPGEGVGMGSDITKPPGSNMVMERNHHFQ